MMNQAFSPADSLLSSPSDPFQPMFSGEGELTVMTPQSSYQDRSSVSPSEADMDKKQSPKKRKSWGQELPTPKTNLPPRKRAKTEDEKEQRRIERVLRNRAAAQSSRERKRKEVECLEVEKEDIVRQNSFLSTRLREVEMQNSQLSQQIAKMAAEMTAFRKVVNGNLPSPAEEKSISPALSSTVFPKQEPGTGLADDLDHLEFSLPPPHSHVDPRSAEFNFSPSGTPEVGSASVASPSMTQHPAAVLCDLQCQLGATQPRPSDPSDLESKEERFRSAISLSGSYLLLATMVSTTSSLLTQPLAAIFHSLKTGSPLSGEIMSPARITSLFPLIHWLISTPTNPLSILDDQAHHITPSTTAQHTSSDNLSLPTFRISLLRRLLACSPALARPLRDATGQALQLMSSGSLMTAGELNGVGGVTVSGSPWDMGDQQSLAATSSLRSSLMTMWYAIDTVERAREKAGHRVEFNLLPRGPSLAATPTLGKFPSLKEQGTSQDRQAA